MVILILPKRVVLLEMMKMELNDREKFIVHFMAATIFGMRENASEYAISSAVEKLRKARCKNLTVADGKKLIDAVLDEATRGTMIITDRNVRTEDLV